VGAYHEYTFTDPPGQQAFNFTQTAKLGSGDFQPIIWLNTKSGSPPAGWRSDFMVFLNVLRTSYPAEPILMIDPQFASSHLPAGFPGSKLWLLGVPSGSGGPPAGWTQLSFAQIPVTKAYSGVGFSGFETFFPGTQAEFQALLLP